jgi:hypothetical protein
MEVSIIYRSVLSLLKVNGPLQRALLVLLLCLGFSQAQAQSSITRVEYYIDNDPGYGNGTALNVAAGADIQDAVINLQPSSLTEGVHRLYVRAQDAAGSWSQTNTWLFYKPYGNGTAPGTIPVPNITRLEYYIDNDPGQGNGTLIPTSANTDIQDIVFGFNPSVLTAGVHRLYVRALDAAGNWSLTNTLLFYKPYDPGNAPTLPPVPGLVRVEYYLDNDPGFGNATELVITGGTDVQDAIISINPTLLTTGVHRLYVRARDANGNWSLTNSWLFFRPYSTTEAPPLQPVPNLSRVEYYIDNDPGYGNGTAVPFTAGTELSDAVISINPDDLTAGTHRLYVRARDANGAWGLTNIWLFYKPFSPGSVPPLQPSPALTRIEYYIDTDPGVGNGKNVPFTPGTDVADIVIPIQISGLTFANHVLYVRAKDAAGNWSLVNKWPFSVEPPAPIYVTVGNLPDSICAGTPLRIPYTVNTAFGAGNVFTAQLSDKFGSFVSPVTIGTITSSLSDTISTTIPANTLKGEGYLVRILSTNPQDTSYTSATTLTVVRKPEQNFTIVGSNSNCLGQQSYKASDVEPNVIWKWNLSGGGTLTSFSDSASIDWTTAGSHTITLSDSNSCGVGLTRTLHVTVYAGAPTLTPTISVSNRTLHASNPNSTTVKAYQWYRNDTLLAGAVNSSYLAAIDATYKVAYTNPCGTGPFSAPVTVNTLLTQTVVFDSIPNKIFGDAPFTVNAVASSGLAVTYSIVSGPASVTGNTITLQGAGTVRVRAAQAGNATYAAAFAERTFIVAAPPSPDLTVTNVPNTRPELAPGDTVTLSWNIKNIGTAATPMSWTERIYVQSINGQNRTLVKQRTFTGTGNLDTGILVPRTDLVQLPLQLNIGDQGVFAVEVVPANGVTEVSGGYQNNIAAQPTAWNIKKLLTLELSAPQVTEGGTITGTVKRTGSYLGHLLVNITLGNPSRFTYPATMNIPAGQAGVSFVITSVDNSVIEGTLNDSVRVSATGFQGAQANFSVLENDLATLTISELALEAMEGDSVNFRITTTQLLSTPQQVFLTSSSPTTLAVPPSVTIPAGSLTTMVRLKVQQDSIPEMDVTVTINAGAAGCSPTSKSILIKDNDIPGLELVIQTSSVSETGGPFATQATLRRKVNSNNIAFTANLSTNLPNNLMLPSAISLAAGEREKTFHIGVIDNTQVDGDRNVIVTAAIYVPSCGCNASSTSSGSFSDTLKVTDNDGPALQVTAAQLTLAEGLANAGTIRVARNTPAALPLTVNLSSSDTAEARLPASVVIPAGSSFIDVVITTINDNATDGNKQVYFHATATSFSTGSVWVMVTDLNKPDLQITNARLNDTAVQAMSIFNYEISIKNTGAATAPSGALVRGYLSLDGVIDASDSLLTSDVVAASIPAGQTVQVLNAVLAPDRPGKWKVLFKVNDDLAMVELLTTNNTSAALNLTIKPDYTVTAQVTNAYFFKGVPVPVTGVATRSNGQPARNKPVDVYVITNGLRRTVSATTDTMGNYSAQWTPMASEAGHYTIGACFPGLKDTVAQDAFDILGLRIQDGIVPQFRVVLNDTLRGNLSIRNLSAKSLQNVTLQPLNLPNGAKMLFDPLPLLAGNQTVNLPYRIIGSSLSPGSNFEVTTLQVKSTEGDIQKQDMLYYCQAPAAYITADRTRIDVTVSTSNGEKLVEVKLVNRGMGATGNININLPQVSWLSSVTPVVMPSIAPGDTAVVVLKFKAMPDVPFNYPINGSIGIGAQNGNTFALPFTFEKVAETTGAVKVVVTNQFTYYTAGEPKVKDAKVVIKNYFTGAVYAQGYTDSAGVFMAGNVPEGQHRITVEKEKHLPYNNTLIIVPGDTIENNVFINYQAITFSWNVVPTAIQDQYTVTLTTVFETHVPMPVVIISMPDTMPQLSGTETYAFNVTLTNHGLITAKDVALNLPTNDAEYEFITNYVPGDLLGQQAIQVPVIMRRRTGPPPGGRYGTPSYDQISQFLGISSARVTSGGNCQDFTSVVYWYTCNLSSGNWEKGGKLFTYSGRTCTPSPGSTDGIYVNIGPGGPGGYPSCAYCPPPIYVGVGTTPPVQNPKKSCAQCLNELAQAVLGCVGIDIPPPLGCGLNTLVDKGSVMDYVSCLFQAYTVGAVVGAVAKKVPGLAQLLCLKDILGALETCLNTAEGRSNLLRNYIGSNGRTTSGMNAVLEEIYDNLKQVEKAYQMRINWNTEYFGALSEYDSWYDFYAHIDTYVDSLDAIPQNVQAPIIAAMSGFDMPDTAIQAFFTRWNLSIQARDAGVLQPNSQYPGIINWMNIKAYSDSLVDVHNLAVTKGYESVDNMHEENDESMDVILDGQKNEVCANVTVQFSQSLTMTREAFDGTLDIFNGHPTDAMDSISVFMSITDAAGVPSNGLFQINTGALTNLANVTGTGNIASQQHGIVKFLFIPEPGAAPTVPKVYNFGGSVRYWDPYVGAMVTMPLSPVPITVNPSPNLMLHYFMQRNILGDDALTSPEIEPMVPAELSVMVENQGFGPAVNMTISSAAPKIVENESGLSINFSMVGSAFQGDSVSLGLSNINFGTVPARQTRVGQWYFTSSLLGKFVSYESNVVHDNSFGNPELSLVKGVKLHELTKSIRAYTNNDGINDFLVNDIFDVNDMPDIIYFSQGMRTEKVDVADTGSFSSLVIPPTFTNTLTVTASDTGWNYIKLPDPGKGFFELQSVTRSDGQVIPLNNAWLTFVTLPVNRPPLYEDNFHLVDTFPSLVPVSYTVVWKPKNFDVPKVDTITGAPANVSPVQVQYLTVVFNKAIDSTTFTRDDLTLRFQGGANIIDPSVVITRIDTATFRVDLSSLTLGNGLYTFTAQAAGVKDVYGINGTTGKQVSWTQFLTVPTVQAFQGIPANNMATAFDSIQVLFNMPIDTSTVTPQRFIITKDGVQQAGSIIIDSVRADRKLFYLSGLQNILTQSGTYVLTVDVPNIKSQTGVSGMQQQSITLILDNTGPLMVTFAKSDSGSLGAQHYPYIKMHFNEEVSGFNTASLELRRNGELLPLNIAQLSNTDLKTWLAGNFGMLTYPDGNYTFAINLAGLKDMAGNAGTGTQVLSWSVERSSLITISNLVVNPDLGFSNTDGLTSGLSLSVQFDIDTAATQIQVSQTDLSGETVLATRTAVSRGAVQIPVTLAAGGTTKIRVTAIGVNGALSVKEKDLFVDLDALTAKWLQAPNQTVGTQVDTLGLNFSARLLSDTGLHRAMRFSRNGTPVSTAALQIERLNDTAYIVKGIRTANSLPGSYVLQFSLDSFSKYRTGRHGSGAVSLAWTVQSTNRAPIARAGNDTTVNAPASIQLHGNGSSDPDGDVITYRWVAPAGIVLNDSTLASPTFGVTAANRGQTYSFLLIVSDGDLFHTDVVKVTVGGAMPTVLVSVKAFLQGPYMAANGLMVDSLRVRSLLPVADPYPALGFISANGATPATMNAGVMDSTGNAAIVDWVWLELRNKADARQVLGSRSALIRRDGQVVDMDGVSPVVFSDIAPDAYYVAIRHRNHLGVMASATVTLNDATASLVDFTLGSTATYGTDAQATQNGVKMLWSGDVNGNSRVSYNGANNDKNALLAAVGLNTPNNILIIYHRADVNLDGRVRYNGAANDKNAILSAVGLSTPNRVIIEQLPN